MIEKLQSQLRLEFPYALAGRGLSYPVEMSRFAYTVMVRHITDEAKIRKYHKR
jgi:hypothetical protein